jgi:hypothetical protein
VVADDLIAALDTAMDGSSADGRPGPGWLLYNDGRTKLSLNLLEEISVSAKSANDNDHLLLC